MDTPRPRHLSLDSASALTLFQESGDGLLLVDPATEQIREANPMACRLTEYSHEELLAMSMQNLLEHEQGRHEWLQPVQKTLTFHNKDGFLLRTRHPGVWVPVAITIARLHPPGMEPLALFTLRDRREQVEAYRRIQRTEAELRHVLVSVSDCLWSCRIEPDGRWRYRYLSPVMQKLTGRNVSAILEDPRAREQCVDPVDLPRWRQFVARLTAGHSGELEYRLQRNDGATVWVRENVTVVPENGGFVLHGVIGDISERKRAEQEAARIQRLERVRLEGLASLAGRLARDFNRLVLGIVEGLREIRQNPHVSLDAVEARALVAMELCGRVETILGQPPTVGQTSDLQEVLQRAVDSLRLRIPTEVSVELPTDSSRIVQGNNAQLVELFVQLLENALDAVGNFGRIVVRYLPAGIEVGAAADLDYAVGPLLWLEVEDNGSGVPAEAMGHLFEPFYSTQPGHFGLGLATVMGIIRAHRGAIRVLSTPGSGTRIRVGLPFTPPARPPEMDERPLVLLADDEAAVRDVVSRLISSLGCRVLAAGDGQEALDLFAQHATQIRLAMIDLTMPRLDGEPTLRRLRHAAPELPLVLISGYPESHLTSRFADMRLTGFLQKPFRLPSLVAVLRQAGLQVG